MSTAESFPPQTHERYEIGVISCRFPSTVTRIAVAKGIEVDRADERTYRKVVRDDRCTEIHHVSGVTFWWAIPTSRRDDGTKCVCVVTRVDGLPSFMLSSCVFSPMTMSNDDGCSA